MSDVAARIHKIFYDTLNPKPAAITDGTTWGGLSMDSLDYAEIAMSIEDEFDIKMLADDMMTVTTMGELIALVEKKVATPA